MTEQQKPPPEDESSAFKRLLEKLVKVPKTEMNDRKREYQRKLRRVKSG